MKIRKIGKKGAVHIEMIVSFILFISFIVFLLWFFKPAQIFSKSPTASEVTESSILDYVSTNLTLSSIKINQGFTIGQCLYVGFNLTNNTIVKSESSIVNADYENGYLYFGYDGGFYRIFSSEELEEKSIDHTTCTLIDDENYTLGLTRDYSEVSYSKLITFNDSYYNNYSQLKKDLKIRNDFNFIIQDSSGIMFQGKRYTPQGIDLMAKDIAIEILDKNASLDSAILNIQTWE